MWYDELTNDVNDRIQDTGFEDFILALPDAQGQTDYQPLHALMERWSDTTHTFHLPCGSLHWILCPLLLLLGSLAPATRFLLIQVYTG